MTAQLGPDAIRPLGEDERFDWLRLLRCDNIGPRSFIALLRRHGSAGAALEALPALVASGKAGRPITISVGVRDRGGNRETAGLRRCSYRALRAGLSGVVAADPSPPPDRRPRRSCVPAPLENRSGWLAQRLGRGPRLYRADFARPRAGRPRHRFGAGARHRCALRIGGVRDRHHRGARRRPRQCLPGRPRRTT